ncbi:hypothetical protein ADUPG1_009813, partial [Aduncisulcus paluster]
MKSIGKTENHINSTSKRGSKKGKEKECSTKPGLDPKSSKKIPESILFDYTEGKDCYYCAQCHAKFSSINKMEAHAKIENHKSFACSKPGCSSSFDKKGNLTLHINSVHGSKKHECTICGKYFTQKGHLTRHIRSVHESKTQYGCPLCDYSAIQIGDLHQHHISNHTPFFPYVCSICGESFAIEPDLTAHIKKSHPKLSSLTHKKLFIPNNPEKYVPAPLLPLLSNAPLCPCCLSPSCCEEVRVCTNCCGRFHFRCCLRDGSMFVTNTCNSCSSMRQMVQLQPYNALSSHIHALRCSEVPSKRSTSHVSGSDSFFHPWSEYSISVPSSATDTFSFGDNKYDSTSNCSHIFLDFQPSSVPLQTVSTFPHQGREFTCVPMLRPGTKKNTIVFSLFLPEISVDAAIASLNQRCVRVSELGFNDTIYLPLDAKSNKWF